MIKKLFFAVFFLLGFTMSVHATEAYSSNLLPNTGNQACTNNLASGTSIGTGGQTGTGCKGSMKDLQYGNSATETTNQGFDVRAGSGVDWGTGGTKDIEANGNLTIGSSGSLENLDIITENATSHTTTADSLDGGVTLKSATETQNCEWQQSNYRCGSSQGSADSFTVRVQIKDASGNVLATVEQTRQTDAGYRQNTAIHEDTVTHTGEGARNWDWQWTGTDGYKPNAQNSKRGPNLLGATLQLTLLDINYSPTPPISEETQEEIEEAQETVEEVESIIENIPLEEVISGVEEVAITEPTVEIEEPAIEEPTVEIEEQAFQESFQENFTAVLEEEGLTETFEEALVEEGITEEQFFEAVTEMVTEEFATPTEESAVEEPAVEEEPVVEETPAETETVNTTEESVETESETNTPSETSETGTQEANGETESTSSETESEGTEETESSEQEESTSNDQESVEDSGEAGQNESEGDQDTSVGEIEVEAEISEIASKVEKIIKKLESKLKTIDQKLKVISLVTAQAMVEDQPDLTQYKMTQFYDKRKMPDNPDWYAEDTLLNAYGRSIYQDKTLIAYQTNDPMFVREQELNRVNENITRLEAELEILRNENNR
jgi:hypothetical protein